MIGSLKNKVFKAQRFFFIREGSYYGCLLRVYFLQIKAILRTLGTIVRCNHHNQVSFKESSPQEVLWTAFLTTWGGVSGLGWCQAQKFAFSRKIACVSQDQHRKLTAPQGGGVCHEHGALPRLGKRSQIRIIATVCPPQPTVETGAVVGGINSFPLKETEKNSPMEKNTWKGFRR